MRGFGAAIVGPDGLAEAARSALALAGFAVLLGGIAVWHFRRAER